MFCFLNSIYIFFKERKKLFTDSYELIYLLNISHWCVCCYYDRKFWRWVSWNGWDQERSETMSLKGCCQCVMSFQCLTRLQLPTLVFSSQKTCDMFLTKQEKKRDKTLSLCSVSFTLKHITCEEVFCECLYYKNS